VVVEDDDGQTYVVVMNDEEQYSICPASRAVPDGWRQVGKSGTKAECLGYVDEVWTDLRPLSVRRQMAENPRRS
jgi:MbtH protein